MYAELRMELEPDGLSFRQSSNLQGVIMENVDEAYAQQLHAGSLNPYSQCVVREGDKMVWYIRTTTEEAYERLIVPISGLSEFSLKKGKLQAKVLDRRIGILEDETLLKEFYETPGERFMDVRFQTPTAFKSSGRYVFYPDLHLFYQSLMSKYTMASDKFSMVDEDTLEQLEDNSEIVRYRLQSVPFPLERVAVTGFTGTIRIHIRGTDTMARYARLLMQFGCYSGVGIKASMGMGAMQLMKRREKL